MGRCDALAGAVAAVSGEHARKRSVRMTLTVCVHVQQRLTSDIPDCLSRTQAQLSVWAGVGVALARGSC